MTLTSLDPDNQPNLKRKTRNRRTLTDAIESAKKRTPRDLSPATDEARESAETPPQEAAPPPHRTQQRYVMLMLPEDVADALRRELERSS